MSGSPYAVQFDMLLRCVLPWGPTCRRCCMSHGSKLALVAACFTSTLDIECMDLRSPACLLQPDCSVKAACHELIC